MAEEWTCLHHRGWRGATGRAFCLNCGKEIIGPAQFAVALAKEATMAEETPQGVLEAPGEGRMSKTKVTAAATTVAAAIYAVAGLMGTPIPIPQDVAIGLLGSALALGQYFLRRAL